MRIGQRVKYILKDWPFIFGEEGEVVRVYDTGGYTVKLDAGAIFLARNGFVVI